MGALILKFFNLILYILIGLYIISLTGVISLSLPVTSSTLTTSIFGITKSDVNSEPFCLDWSSQTNRVKENYFDAEEFKEFLKYSNINYPIEVKLGERERERRRILFDLCMQSECENVRKKNA